MAELVTRDFWRKNAVLAAAHELINKHQERDVIYYDAIIQTLGTAIGAISGPYFDSKSNDDWVVVMCREVWGGTVDTILSEYCGEPTSTCVIEAAEESSLGLPIPPYTVQDLTTNPKLYVSLVYPGEDPVGSDLDLFDVAHIFSSEVVNYLCTPEPVQESSELSEFDTRIFKPIPKEGLEFARITILPLLVALTPIMQVSYQDMLNIGIFDMLRGGHSQLDLKASVQSLGLFNKYPMLGTVYTKLEDLLSKLEHLAKQKYGTTAGRNRYHRDILEYLSPWYLLIWIVIPNLLQNDTRSLAFLEYYLTH